jgi:hypothetical protein
MRPRRLFTALVTLALLAFPAGAAADDFQQIFGDYKSDGRIDNCYAPDQIHNAGRSIPPDIEQYAPGFGDALSSAQSQCGSGGQQPTAESDEDEKPAPVSAGGASGPDIKKKKAVAEPPAPEVAPTAASTELAAPQLPAAAAVSNDTPGALVALLIAAGIAVVLALAWTIAWFMGWSPERLTKPVVAAFQSVWDRVLPGR